MPAKMPPPLALPHYTYITPVYIAASRRRRHTPQWRIILVLQVISAPPTEKEGDAAVIPTKRYRQGLAVGAGRNGGYKTFEEIIIA